ncbi:hypothetical protein TNCV_3506871 [Trichonephila clavipes]|uniref:Uncharacterized protein n=1 Tax=Trichonephila clavipes TaxID=2585209 RepID=A0A8X6RVX6_TRICX|nr:hypothetical protein TNCV_3506871 [Trichonephila clavipes]
MPDDCILDTPWPGVALKVLERENFSSGAFRDGQSESDIRSKKFSVNRLQDNIGVPMIVNEQLEPPPAWLQTRPAQSATMPEWRTTTCSNSLDFISTRLTTSSVGTRRLGIKWSKNQAQALVK